ncbi:hypothetical protein BJV38_002143 [Clostridium beijerinckii]|uniref:hypothetical protein n=1 Tax=Clostridium beijerinckii TaxID=1520 RepID=UPI001570C0C3|nr:hypothetical protein [Clostridium beijerinckii]NRT35271.1 hypothetical protein [Clostridium beijerinckii]NRT45300.1 hypothetical protein [Clostridium beijerinckii]NRZ20703.1 hypothetical protein [Clostridium beijerinckii]
MGAIGEFVMFAVAVVVTAIYGVVAHNSESSSSDAPAISDPFEYIGEEEKKIEKTFKGLLLLGIVTIASMISTNEAKQKQERQEIIESISSDLEGSTTSIAINSAQDVIQELKDVSVFDSISGTITEGVNDVNADVNKPSPIPNPLMPPSIPYEYKTIPPIVPPVIQDGGAIQNPLNPPDVGQITPPPLAPPEDGPTNPPPLVPPVVGMKGVEDYINWVKKNKTKENTNSNDNNESGDKEKMLGENGTQVASETTWQNGKTERIDVENPSPGKRPGQIHYHEPNNTKWYFDIIKKVFYDPKTGQLAPKKIQKLLDNDDFIKGINKALKLLGENKLK